MVAEDAAWMKGAWQQPSSDTTRIETCCGIPHHVVKFNFVDLSATTMCAIDEDIDY